MSKPKLKLPDVTLVLIETREHALACLALEECVKKVDFGDVLVMTDRPLEFAGLTKHCDFRTVVVPDWPVKEGWSRAFWYDVSPHVRTCQTLNIQWDSWVVDPAQWDPGFMAYDYIGAPWWYTDGKNVGNGGFSLISTRLKRFVRERRWNFPCDTALDDDLFSRRYRPQLEEFGFVWAPEQVAHCFAFECCRPAPDSKHFGFHGAFNFSEVLAPEPFVERVQLMMASKYISNPNGHIWKAFNQKHPGLVDKLQEELVRLKGAGSA